MSAAKTEKAKLSMHPLTVKYALRSNYGGRMK